MTDNKINKVIHNLELACERAARQQKEIDRLKNELHGKVEYIHEQREVIDEKKAEIEKLKSEKEAIDDFINPLPFKTSFDFAKKVKSEAIREFAENVKTAINERFSDEIQDSNSHLYLMNTLLDNLVKEITEESNDQ